jgi:hypothetical protein
VGQKLDGRGPFGRPKLGKVLLKGIVCGCGMILMAVKRSL